MTTATDPTPESQPCSDAVCFDCGAELGGWGYHVTHDGLLQFVCRACRLARAAEDRP